MVYTGVQLGKTNDTEVLYSAAEVKQQTAAVTTAGDT